MVKTDQALKASDYTADSWTTFQKALSGAQKLLIGKPSQSELDAAATALKAAKTKLVLASTTDLPSTGSDQSSAASSSNADQTQPSGDQTSNDKSGATAKYPNTGESQLSLFVEIAAFILTLGMIGAALFLRKRAHDKAK